MRCPVAESMRGGASKAGWRMAAPAILLAAVVAGACSGPEPAAPAAEPGAAGDAVEAPEAAAEVRGAHEAFDNPQETFTDERGLTVEGLGVDFPARAYPASTEFPTGPALGERLPEFTLPNQHGEPVDFHVDRAGQGAVVVFYRSAVW